MFVNKVQIECAFSVFFTFSMLVVKKIGTDSFEWNISLTQFQNLVGLFLLSNNKSFWYFCLACLTYFLVLLKQYQLHSLFAFRVFLSTLSLVFINVLISHVSQGHLRSFTRLIILEACLSVIEVSPSSMQSSAMLTFVSVETRF